MHFTIKQLLDTAKHIWPVPSCLLCHAVITKGLLCDPCLNTLPWNTHACYLCGLPLHERTLCGNCLTQAPAFTSTTALFRYEQPIINFITQLKFNQRLLYANFFGKLFKNHITKTRDFDSLPQCIIPIPLHNKRLRKRGFNQALEIARPIANGLSIPIIFDCCQRIKNTQSQSKLPAKKRRKNIHNAFELCKPINAKHVAIFDDVVTTGNTVRELSKLLHKSGVEEIEIWCCARVGTL